MQSCPVSVFAPHITVQEQIHLLQKGDLLRLRDIDEWKMSDKITAWSQPSQEGGDFRNPRARRIIASVLLLCFAC